ncbi:ankyrin repeat domain-containing protein [Fusarium circinatum]|uniref:Ankyrin repeat domain-containing protein n=1 Tax=Fusarium circinatum TaxID=48490 RepID=A0A8H5TVM2_FUSCI|nr:ankyrin repeat domain-containing protein [Fusarium circinatum]
MADSDKERAFALLRWTAFALRPLIVYEITEAVLIAEDLEDFPFEEMPDCVDQDYLKKYLLLKTFPGTTTLLSNDKLRVTNESLHNITLAKCCLHYISFRGVWEILKTNSNKGSGKHFMFYAVQQGFPHCRYVENIDPELQQAVSSLLDSRNENWHFVKEFTETKILGDDPDFQDFSISPLVFAVIYKLTDAVAQLIREGGSDMNDRSFGNSTPLFWACHTKNKEIVELLVDNGADINAKCNRGRTPLHISAEDGRNGITELLISRGADISVVDDENQTLLNMASNSGNTEVARQLIDSGADISHETIDGYTPLSMASIEGHVDFAKLLIERGADVNQVVANGHPPLLEAVWYNHLELAELLMDEGAELTGIEVNGQMFSLLAVAAGNGHLSMAKFLISRGLEPTEAQSLLLAASYGSYYGFTSDFDAKEAAKSPRFPRPAYYQVLELLLKSGADVNTSDGRGLTPIHMASSDGFIDIVEILIQEGADLNVKTIARQTPLHSCSAKGHLGVTQLLIQHGANVDSKDNHGRNALYHACKSGDLEVVNLIIASSQIQTLDEADHWGSTPLSIAARFGHVGILRRLIYTGAVEVESSDRFGRTTAWWAASRNHDAAVRLLARTNVHGDLGTDVEESEAVQRQLLEIEAYCDICWLDVLPGQTRVHCGICNGGDFDMCSACVSLGGHCLDATHELVPIEAKVED